MLSIVSGVDSKVRVIIHRKKKTKGIRGTKRQQNREEDEDKKRKAEMVRLERYM